jgi:protein ImuA
MDSALTLAPLGFGLPALDAALPGGGLSHAALHDVAGSGPEMEHAGAATLFVAGILARLCAGTAAPALWVLHQRDLFAPALAGAGLDPDRLIYAEVVRPTDVLMALEDALRCRGLAGVVGELQGRLSLTASRRLQLAAEKGGLPCVLLRRSQRHDDPVLAEPSAAVTRWRVAALPAPPPLPHAPDVPGLARARWRLDLVRCRGGEPHTWIVEACDAQGRLGLPDPFPHRPAESERRRAAAGHRTA